MSRNSPHPFRRSTDLTDPNQVLAGGGEVGALLRSMDWSTHPLGPPASWPQSLKTAVSILLNSRYPMFLFWGPELIKIYNDSYRPITGAKHPASLARPGREVWPEIWDTIGPMIDRVVTHGEATWSDDLQLIMERSGYREEVYFTFSYSPIRVESGGIGGMFCACTETTEKVIGARRLRTLSELATIPTEASSLVEACRLAGEVFAKNPAEIPFALVYLFDDDGKEAKLLGHTGCTPGSPACPEKIGLECEKSWPLGRVAKSQRIERVDDLATRFSELPSGPWPEPPRSTLLLPLVLPGHERASGVLLLGVSRYRPFDEAYRNFFELIAAQLAASMGKAKAREEERRRVEALAELDRAKTTFFSNISHEFRTPLTLMIGPTEDLLAGNFGELSEEQRRHLELLHRNERRLQKLVNALLDFSRIEAGRVHASYAPVDLAMLTADLASAFRSAVERAGLTFDVSCPPLGEPVYVDRDMWEKIVLNLLSNALKFTFQGRIAVSLAIEGQTVVLRVADSGIGIAAEELPRLFERFHRIEGARARTHEGSGIGLALVHELVKLQGGTVGAESRVGVGTTFTVRLPCGQAHVPEGGRAAAHAEGGASPRAQRFAEEALHWLAEGPEPAGRAAEPVEGGARARVLLADDNGDMRDYVRRTLEPHFAVEAVRDGVEALAAVRRAAPDVILTDVMMPQLDGFGLLRALKQEGTRHIPVVMLSARAGEEARLEGLAAGADDYLVKPFSARELIARIRLHVENVRLRRAVAAERDRLRSLLGQAPAIVNFFRGPELIFEYAHPLAVAALGGRSVVGKPFVEAVPEVRDAEFPQLLRRVVETGERVESHERRAVLVASDTGKARETYWNSIYLPVRDHEGRIEGVMTFDLEVTDEVLSRRALEESEAKFRRIVTQVQAGIVQIDKNGRFTLANARFCEIVGRTEAELAGLTFLDITHPEDVADSGGRFQRMLVDSAAFVFEKRFVRPDGQAVWVQNSVSRLVDGSGESVGATTICIDVTELKKAVELEKRLREEAEQARHFSDLFIGILGHDLRNPLSAITTAANLLELRADSERIAKPVERIAFSADRMERMISQLLDLTRIRLGRGLPLERTEVALDRLAHAIIDELGATGRREIALDCMGDLVGSWDRDRLAQLLSNLIANACQHGVGGSPVLVRLDGTQKESVRIEVKNQGTIPAEVLPSLFEPLHPERGRREKREGSSGLGLGLYISQQIVVGHGGTIEVESHEPGTTSFVILLPRHPAPSDAGGSSPKMGRIH